MVVNGREERVAAEVAATLDGAIGIGADVTDLESVRSLCARARDALGSVDVLVNNAGIASRHAITRVTDDEWFESLAVNLTGPMYLIRELVPGMKRNAWGRILNVTSTAGTDGVAGFSAYGAAKGGIVALTYTLARELARFGIRVNALSPAALTDMLQQLPPELLDPMIEAGLPTVDDCAAAALELLGEDAPTGRVVAVEPTRAPQPGDRR